MKTQMINGKEYKIQSYLERKYSVINMLSFATYVKQREIEPIHLIKIWHQSNPEPTDAQKYKFLMKALSEEE